MTATNARDATLLALREWEPPSPQQSALRRRFVDHLQAHPDGLLRSCRPDHITSSVLVMSPDTSQVLLTLHAKAGQWFQLGGHLEPTDADVVAAATREAREESGIPGLALDPEPVHLDEHPVPFCGRGARHLDVRFVALADPEGGHQASEESTDLRWWPVDLLPGEDLGELVDLARTRVRGE